MIRTSGRKNEGINYTRSSKYGEIGRGTYRGVFHGSVIDLRGNGGRVNGPKSGRFDHMVSYITVGRPAEKNSLFR